MVGGAVVVVDAGGPVVSEAGDVVLAGAGAVVPVAPVLEVVCCVQATTDASTTKANRLIEAH